MLSLRDRALVLRELSTTLRAGLSPMESLHAMASAGGSASRSAERILERLQGGRQPLAPCIAAEGLSRSEGLFLVGAEETGRLPEALARIADETEARIQIRRRIRKALFYPVLVLFATPIIVAIPAGVLSGIAGYLGVALPPLLGVGGATALVVLLFRSPAAPSLPGLRKLREEWGLARAALTISHVWSAGLDPRRALREAADASGHPGIARALRAGAEKVARGAGLGAAVDGLHPQFVNFLRTGERTGGVDVAMRDAHRYYETEAAHRLEIVLGWVKWIVFLVAAGWAGWWIVTRFVAFVQGDLA